MGAERWLLFASMKQANAARTYLAPLNGSVGNEEGDCWLEWVSPLKLEVGYSFGPANSECAYAVCREIAKRFKLRRIGADSVGWYAESDWQSKHEQNAPARYGEHANWVEWVKVWKPEWSFILSMGDPFALREQIEAVDALVTAKFKELDEDAKCPRCGHNLDPVVDLRRGCPACPWSRIDMGAIRARGAEEPG